MQYTSNLLDFKQKMASLNQEVFDQLDLADLLIKIWDFSEHVHHMSSPDPSSCACEHYLQLCVNAARNKWSPDYMYFDTINYHIQFHHKKFESVMRMENETVQKVIFYEKITHK